MGSWLGLQSAEVWSDDEVAKSLYGPCKGRTEGCLIDDGEDKTGSISWVGQH